MASTSKLSAEFNDFLFATVCDEGGERRLSVISALARLDLDPWAEAADLARMPAESAARRLTSLLAGVVTDPAGHPDRATMAERLVALLPTSAKTYVRAQAGPVLIAPHLRAARIMWLAFLASMALSVLVANFAPRAGMRSLTPTPTPAASAGH